MAVTELVFPAVKPSPEDREEFKRTWPTLSKTFESYPDVHSGFYGWMVEENGADVRADWRFVLLLEWDKYSSFTTFLSSPEYRSFGGIIKPLLAGPAKPQLYETDRGPATCASAPVTEIFQLTLPASGLGSGMESDSESGVGVRAAEKAWREFVGVVEREGEGLVRGAIGGRSMNLEAKVWVGVVGWENLEARETVRRKPEVQHGLRALREAGETSIFLVELKALGTEMS